MERLRCTNVVAYFFLMRRVIFNHLLLPHEEKRLYIIITFRTQIAYIVCASTAGSFLMIKLYSGRRVSVSLSLR
jgi:hypothetical protein